VEDETGVDIKSQTADESIFQKLYRQALSHHEFLGNFQAAREGEHVEVDVPEHFGGARPRGNVVSLPVDDPEGRSRYGVQLDDDAEHAGEVVYTKRIRRLPKVFEVDQRVVAQCSNGLWYKATVREVLEEGHLLLMYDNPARVPCGEEVQPAHRVKGLKVDSERSSSRNRGEAFRRLHADWGLRQRRLEEQAKSMHLAICPPPERKPRPDPQVFERLIQPRCPRFVVKEVLAERSCKDGCAEFLVHEQGFEDVEPFWLHERNIDMDMCGDVVRDFRQAREEVLATGNAEQASVRLYNEVAVRTENKKRLREMREQEKLQQQVLMKVEGKTDLQLRKLIRRAGLEHRDCAKREELLERACEAMEKQGDELRIPKSYSEAKTVERLYAEDLRKKKREALEAKRRMLEEQQQQENSSSSRPCRPETFFRLYLDGVHREGVLSEKRRMQELEEDLKHKAESVHRNANSDGTVFQRLYDRAKDREERKLRAQMPMEALTDFDAFHDAMKNLDDTLNEDYLTELLKRTAPAPKNLLRGSVKVEPRLTLQQAPRRRRTFREPDAEPELSRERSSPDFMKATANSMRRSSSTSGGRLHSSQAFLPVPAEAVASARELHSRSTPRPRRLHTSLSDGEELEAWRHSTATRFPSEVQKKMLEEQWGHQATPAKTRVVDSLQRARAQPEPAPALSPTPALTRPQRTWRKVAETLTGGEFSGTGGQIGAVSRGARAAQQVIRSAGAGAFEAAPGGGSKPGRGPWG